MGKTYSGSSRVKKAFYGSTSVKAIYYGSTKIYPMYEAFTLTFAPATQNISVTCSRTSSPSANAFTGSLSSGATIYTDDVLVFTVTASGTSYYVAEADTITASYTQTITVTGNVIKRYHAVVQHGKTLPSSVKSANYAINGQYPWSYSFVTDGTPVSDPNSPYYPTTSTALLGNGHISSVSETSITVSGWLNTGNERVRGNVTYYSYAPDIVVVNAPQITSVNYYNGGSQLQIVFKNPNSFAATLYVSYSYDDTSGDSGSASEYSLGSVSANSTKTFILNTQTGTSIDWAIVDARLYYNGTYSDYEEYET